jgi:hypothetical protein
MREFVSFKSNLLKDHTRNNRKRVYLGRPGLDPDVGTSGSTSWTKAYFSK